MKNHLSHRLIITYFVLVAQIVLFAQTEWVKIIPSEYSDIYFDSPSVGWAAGEGVVRKTTDGGETWKTVLSDKEANITRIEFGYGGGRGYGISSDIYSLEGYGAEGTLFYASNGGNNWEKLNLPDYHFSDVSIDYDAQQGYQAWFAARETVLYCKSFSNNLVERRYGIDKNHNPTLIKFIEDQIGWVMTNGLDTVSSSIKSYLYHTTDGGLNWNLVYTFEDWANNMRFSIGGIGIVSIANNLYKSEDFGYTWDKINLPQMQSCKINDIIKEDINTRIWIAGEFNFGDNLNYSLLFNESPFYDMWQPDSSFSSNNSYIKLNRLCLPTPSDGRKIYIAGDDIYKADRDDYSSNWISSLFKVKDYSLNDLHFFDTQNGISVGSHKGIMKTTDAGDSWKDVTSDENSDSQLFKVFFLNENKGWTCGSKGLIMITNDGGETWTEINSGAHSELHDIYFVNETRGIAVGGSWASINGGESHFYQSLLTTNDGGYNWEVFEQQVFYDVLFTDELRAIYFIDENEGWIAGGNSIMHTTNAGETWENIYDVPQPAASGPYGIQDLYFSDKYNGIAAGGGYPDNVWRTTDGGNSWLDVTWDNQWSHGGYGIYDVEFASGKFWAVGSDNTYTSNYYGSMWGLDYQKGYWPAPNSLFMLDENNAFISGGRSFARRQKAILTSIEQNHLYGLISVGEYTLSQNYPNPFNPSTSIAYSVPSNEFVSLKVYDILGKEVAVLVNEEKSAGNYEVNFNAENLSSGIYFYVMTSRNFSKTNKMILLK